MHGGPRQVEEHHVPQVRVLDDGLAERAAERVEQAEREQVRGLVEHDLRRGPLLDRRLATGEGEVVRVERGVAAAAPPDPHHVDADRCGGPGLVVQRLQQGYDGGREPSDPAPGVADPAPVGLVVRGPVVRAVDGRGTRQDVPQVGADRGVVEVAPGQRAVERLHTLAEEEIARRHRPVVRRDSRLPRAGLVGREAYVERSRQGARLARAGRAGLGPPGPGRRVQSVVEVRPETAVERKAGDRLHRRVASGPAGVLLACHVAVPLLVGFVEDPLGPALPDGAAGVRPRPGDRRGWRASTRCNLTIVPAEDAAVFTLGERPRRPRDLPRLRHGRRHGDLRPGPCDGCADAVPRQGSGGPRPSRRAGVVSYPMSSPRRRRRPFGERHRDEVPES